MQSTEQKNFFELIDQLCATFDRPPARDEMRQAYWKALHDVRLSEVRANVDRLIRTATSTSRFPRPGDLRNEPVNEKAPGEDAHYQDAMRRNGEMWPEWHRRDPELAALEHGISIAARTLARDHEGSPQYAEALREDRMLRDQRTVLLKGRVAA